MLTVLIFGDVVGKIGREALKRALPALKSDYAPDLVIANAENLAHGKGLTKSILADLHGSGVDFFTSGNHVFHNPKGPHEVWADPALKDLLIRPANFPDGTPGEGEKTLTLGKKRVLVVNLICQVFMGEPYANPFTAMEAILKRHEGEKLGHRHAHARADRRRPPPAEGHRLPDRHRHDRSALVRPGRRAGRTDQPVRRGRSQALRVPRRGASRPERRAGHD